jgi:hypothetical protein
VTGCVGAIEAARRWREAHEPPPECRLDHELHKRPRFVCRRIGGRDQCGECAKDLLSDDTARITVTEISACE